MTSANDNESRFLAVLAEIEALTQSAEQVIKTCSDDQLQHELDLIARQSPGSPWTPWAAETVVCSMIEAELNLRSIRGGKR